MKPLNHTEPQLVVVDSRPEDYRFLDTIAQREALRLDFAASGCDALRLADELQVDLWLISTQLPDFSGFDVVEMLKPLPIGTAVFLIGAEYRRTDELQALNLGVTKYLVKPLSAEWWSEYRPRLLAATPCIRAPDVRPSPNRVRTSGPRVNLQ